VLALVGPLLIYDALGMNFPALVIGFAVEGLALFTTTKIPLAVRACVASGDFAADIQHTMTKGAIHPLSLLIRISFHVLSRPFLFPNSALAGFINRQVAKPSMARVVLALCETREGRPDDVA
jgi:hypothetical protein